MKPRRRDVADAVRIVKSFAVTTAVFRFSGPGAVSRRASRAMAVPAQPDVTISDGEVWRIARAVWRVKRWLPGTFMCLQTSLVLHDALRANGIPSTLRVGVNLADAELLQAHAWLEAGPYILDDSAIWRAFLPFEPPTASRDERVPLS